MLYTPLRFLIRLGLYWYLPDLQLKNLKPAANREPALIVSNHPNSFFDALVLVAYQPAEMCFLTRGDLFRKPFLNWLLRSLHMIPIYKQSDDEDAEIRNAFTYDECVKQLEQGRKLLIFPEGVSKNHHTLRRFMPEGTRSVIERAIGFDIPIQIQPYVLGYSSFDHLPKSLYLEALTKIDCTEFLENGEVKSSEILSRLRDTMAQHLPGTPRKPNPNCQTERRWMKVPGRWGEFTHRWFYRLVRKQVMTRTKGTIFYDSMLFSVLIFTYPVLVLLLSLFFGLFAGFWLGVIVFVTLPFLAYCWVNSQPIKVQQKDVSDRSNRLKKSGERQGSSLEN